MTTANALLSQPGFRFVAHANLSRRLGRVPTRREIADYAAKIAAKVNAK